MTFQFMISFWNQSLFKKKFCDFLLIQYGVKIGVYKVGYLQDILVHSELYYLLFHK